METDSMTWKKELSLTALKFCKATGTDITSLAILIHKRILGGMKKENIVFILLKVIAEEKDVSIKDIASGLMQQSILIPVKSSRTAFQIQRCRSEPQTSQNLFMYGLSENSWDCNANLQGLLNKQVWQLFAWDGSMSLMLIAIHVPRPKFGLQTLIQFPELGIGLRRPAPQIKTSFPSEGSNLWLGRADLPPNVSSIILSTPPLPTAQHLSSHCRQRWMNPEDSTNCAPPLDSTASSPSPSHWVNLFPHPLLVWRLLVFTHYRKKKETEAYLFFPPCCFSLSKMRNSSGTELT